MREEFSDGSRNTYAYDEAGNRTQMTDATGKYSWTYDSRNLVLSAGGTGGLSTSAGLREKRELGNTIP